MDPDRDAKIGEKEFQEIIAEYYRVNNNENPVKPEVFAAKYPKHSLALTRYFEQDVLDVSGQTLPDGSTQELGGDQTIAPGASLNLNSDALPEEFGRYKILYELGRGAMGAVYLAQDTQLDRKVALKVPQFNGTRTTELLERFYREARAAGNLRHHGICPVYDVGEIGGQHFITMAFIEGHPLRDYSKSSKIHESKQIARVIGKIAMAMAEAHDHDVIHRDLKPANIMIDKNSNPVVMDFGLARRAADNDVKLTHTGAVIGTPAYMSPEQVNGDSGKVGPAADIYSLGVIFYELLTGELPFEGNLLSVLGQIATKEPKPPVEIQANVDPRLEKLCLKMLAKEAKERPSSMHEVARFLSEWSKSTSAEMDQRENRAVLDNSSQVGANGNLESKADLDSGSVLKSEDELREHSSTDLADPSGIPLPKDADAASEKPLSKKRLFWGSISVVAILLLGAAAYFAKGVDSYTAKSSDSHAVKGVELYTVEGGDSHTSKDVDLDTVKSGDSDTVKPPDPTPVAEYETVNALTFSGKQNLNDVSANIPYFYGPFTMECWVLPDRGPDKPFGGKLMRGVVRIWNQGFLQFQTQSGEESPRWSFVMPHKEKDRYYVAMSDPVETLPTQPIHIAAVFDERQTMRLFVNGIPQTVPLELSPGRIVVKNTTKDFSPPKVDDPLMIGMYKFEGMIDEVHISRCARYTEKFSPAQMFVADSHTVGLYHLDEGQGSVLRDSSANGNNGRIRNVQWFKPLADEALTQ